MGEKRKYEVVSPLLCNGVPYDIGGRIDLTEEEAAPLLGRAVEPVVAPKATPLDEEPEPAPARAMMVDGVLTEIDDRSPEEQLVEEQLVEEQPVEDQPSQDQPVEDPAPKGQAAKSAKKGK